MKQAERLLSEKKRGRANLSSSGKLNLLRKYNKKMSSEQWEKDYNQNHDLHWMKDQKPSPLAEELVDDIKKDSLLKVNILEIGIGNGKDSIFFARKGHNVIGIDLAEKAIQAARAKSRGINGIKFEIGDAEKLKFGPNTFDAVYSTAVLHSTPIRLTFRQIYRVLKQGGQAKLFLYTETKTGSAWVRYWTSKEIKKVAEDIGFTVEKFREGYDSEPINIPGIKEKINQETHSAITTLRKRLKGI